MHESTGTPSTWTVQMPHSASWQPILVPVRPRSSRRTSASVRDSGTSRTRAMPLTVSLSSLMGFSSDMAYDV